MEGWRKFLDEFNKIKGRLNITPAFIYLTLKYAGTGDGVSRYLLMKELLLSEASSRTLLKKIRQLNILSPFRGGHLLTEKGKRIFDEISKVIDESLCEIPLKNLASCIHVVIVRGYNRKPDAVSIRDDIIRYGGESAMVLFKTDEDIIFPDSGEKLVQYYPRLSRYLNDKLKLSNGDLLILSGAESCLNARISALNAALKLL